MDIAKLIFNAIDVAFDKKQNNRSFEGEEKVVVTKDVLYSDIDPKICLLDCYYIPKKRGTYPVVFNIHGGGFMAGGKEYRRALCTWFATNGFFVVNVNYGLCPDCSFPTPILHLASALNWVAKFAKILRLDLNRMAVYGDSAGAYYAAMLAALCENEEMQKGFGVKIKAKFAAAVLNCGLYDMNTAIERRLLFDLNKKIFTSYMGMNEDEFASYEHKDLCSPLPFINEHYPATFLIYADKDIFCGGQADFMIKKLDEFDIYYESYHTVSLRKNHCFSLEWSSKEAKETNCLIQRFLDKMKTDSMPKRMSECASPIRECEGAAPKHRLDRSNKSASDKPVSGKKSRKAHDGQPVTDPPQA